SRGEQVPWISSSLAEDFSFIGNSSGGGGRPASPSVANNYPSPQPAPSFSPAYNSPAPPPPPPPLAEPSPPPPRANPAPPVADNPRGNNARQIALADDPTIKNLTDKISANPDDANALYRRGQVYASKGAYSLAIKDFDDTVRLNPKDVEALNNRCWARAVIG